MNNTNRTYLREIQDGVSMNSFNDEFNPDQPEAIPSIHIAMTRLPIGSIN